MPQLLPFFKVILDTTLPIFLIIGLTILLNKRMPLNVNTLSRLSIYLFSPALFLSNISQTELAAKDVTIILAAAAVLCVGMALIGTAVARLMRFERALASAFILTAFIMNTVNFGFPFLEFALGPEALDTAVVFTVAQANVAYILGTYIASRGRSSGRTALRNVLTIPMPYAFVIALFFNVNNTPLPLPVLRAADVLGRAIVPTALVILGLQLSGAKLNGRWKPILAATFTRFIIGSAAAIAVATLFGLQGLTRQVFILEASMPAGVLSGVLSTEFGGDAEFAAATILFTTILGAFFLSGLLLFVT